MQRRPQRRCSGQGYALVLSAYDCRRIDCASVGSITYCNCLRFNHSFATNLALIPPYSWPPIGVWLIHRTHNPGSLKGCWLRRLAACRLSIRPTCKTTGSRADDSHSPSGSRSPAILTVMSLWYNGTAGNQTTNERIWNAFIYRSRPSRPRKLKNTRIQLIVDAQIGWFPIGRMCPSGGFLQTTQV